MQPVVKHIIMLNVQMFHPVYTEAKLADAQHICIFALERVQSFTAQFALNCDIYTFYLCIFMLHICCTLAFFAQPQQYGTAHIV